MKKSMNTAVLIRATQVINGDGTLDQVEAPIRNEVAELVKLFSADSTLDELNQEAAPAPQPDPEVEDTPVKEVSVDAEQPATN